MSFRDQVRWCAVVGLMAAVVAAPATGVSLWLRDGTAADLAAALALLALMLAALLWLGGCLCRPLHKRLYHAVLEPNDLWRGLHARSRLARLWLWLDPAGCDRDA